MWTTAPRWGGPATWGLAAEGLGVSLLQGPSLGALGMSSITGTTGASPPARPRAPPVRKHTAWGHRAGADGVKGEEAGESCRVVGCFEVVGSKPNVNSLSVGAPEKLNHFSAH